MGRIRRSVKILLKRKVTGGGVTDKIILSYNIPEERRKSTSNNDEIMSQGCHIRETLDFIREITRNCRFFVS